jgi:hypothetical protein
MRVFTVGPPDPRASTVPIVQVSEVGETETLPEPAAAVAFVKTMPSAAGIVTWAPFAAELVKFLTNTRNG